MDGLFWKKSLARKWNFKFPTCSQMMASGSVSTRPSVVRRRRVVSFLYCLARLWVFLRMAGSAVLISSIAMGQVVMSRYSLLGFTGCSIPARCLSRSVTWRVFELSCCG